MNVPWSIVRVLLAANSPTPNKFPHRPPIRKRRLRTSETANKVKYDL